VEKQSVILLLGREPFTLSQLHIGLEDAGYAVHTMQHLTDALAWLERFTPALIVLDGQSDDLAYDPWLAGHRLREATKHPIVMLLPEKARSQCVEALRLGMDDCLVRSFHMQELIARIRRIIWRLTEASSKGDSFPRLAVNPISQVVTLNGTVVHLTPTEFRLLYTLFLHAGEPLSHKYLLQAVWGHTDQNLYNRLKLFIWQLRQKLEADPKSPVLILTEQDPRGYSLRVEGQ